MIRVMSSSWWVVAMSNWIGCIKQNPLMIWHMCSPLDDLKILEQQIPSDKEMMLVAECWRAVFAILQQYRCLMSKLTAEWTMMIREDSEQHFLWRLGTCADLLITWRFLMVQLQVWNLYDEGWQFLWVCTALKVFLQSKHHTQPAFEGISCWRSSQLKEQLHVQSQRPD